MMNDPTRRLPEAIDAATRAEEETTASEDQGAEVSSARDPETPADDYEANTRVDDPVAYDFANDSPSTERPDTAIITLEEHNAS